MLLATVGEAPCFEFNAASYLVPLMVLLLNRTVSPKYAGSDSPARSGQFRAGFRYAWNFPAVRTCVFLAAASGMLFNLGVTLPLFTTRVFHLGSGGYGLMMATFGLGALPGALFAASSRRRPTGRSVAWLAVATGACVLATASAVGLGLEIAGLALTGCVSIWFIARANTLVQIETEVSMRGRMMGIWNMALPGTSPITSPMVGWVADSAGPREGFGVAGVALLMTAGLGWRSLVQHVGRSPDAGAVAASGDDDVGGVGTPGNNR